MHLFDVGSVHNVCAWFDKLVQPINLAVSQLKKDVQFQKILLTLKASIVLKGNVLCDHLLMLYVLNYLCVKVVIWYFGTTRVALHV